MRRSMWSSTFPYEPDEKGYARANSGIVLQNLYEIQILDNYKNETAPDQFLRRALLDNRRHW